MTTPKPIPAMRELAQEILKPHWPVIHNMEENAAREREVDRIVAVIERSTVPERVLEAPAAPICICSEGEPHSPECPLAAPASTPGLSAERLAEIKNLYDNFNKTGRFGTRKAIFDLLSELARLQEQIAEYKAAVCGAVANQQCPVCFAENSCQHSRRAASHPAPGGSHE